jgi:hypothetical protein
MCLNLLNFMRFLRHGPSRLSPELLIDMPFSHCKKLKGILPSCGSF